MAISLDNNILKEAEKEAKQLHVSLPELCSMAVQEFLNNRGKSEITKQINAVYANYKPEIDADILQAQYDLLEEDW
ncbi:MAG: hypothetical protein FWB73_05015 [Treponema sp.]|nr:hypothetical protein [Treponema sp.]